MRSVLLFGVVLASLQAAPLAYASGCETEYLPLAGIAGLPRVPAQTCILTSNGTNQKVRVTFLRINEVLAGNLIKKEPTPELDGLFTEASLYQNAISAQLADLFEKFGRKDVQVAEDTSFTVNVRAPSASGKQTWQSASLPLPAKEKGKQRRLWWMTTSFASSLFSEFGRFPIFIKSAAEEIAKTDQWPSGYQMDYDCNYDAIICTTLWTSLKLDQLAEIEKETAGEEKRVERAINESVGDDPEAGDEPSSGESRVTILERPYKSHFDLVRKLATNGLPENFLIASAGYGTPEAADGCDNSVELSFSYYMRPLTLDLAIFENLSDQPISGLSLAGRQFAQSGLHVDDDSAPGSAIDALPATLAARQKWIVPLRMAFSDIFDDWRDADANSGQKMFKRISAKPAKSVFVSDVGIRGSKQGSVKKVKKAFLPPTVPPAMEFIYGPELKLTGFSTELGMQAFNSSAPNQVALTNHEELANADRTEPNEGIPAAEDEQLSGGAEDDTTQLNLHTTGQTESSCPILYTFQSASGDWLNHGKVIKKAQNPENEATEVIEVDPAVRRVRVVEEEPEITFLKRLVLTHTHRDGQEMSYFPVDWQQNRDTPRLLPAYTQAEYTFDVPEASKDNPVIKASVAITGYYKRYDTLRSSLLRTPQSVFQSISGR